MWFENAKISRHLAHPYMLMSQSNSNEYVTLVHLHTAFFHSKIKISPYLDFIIHLNVVDLSLITRAAFTDL